MSYTGEAARMRASADEFWYMDIPSETWSLEERRERALPRPARLKLSNVFQQPEQQIATVVDQVYAPNSISPNIRQLLHWPSAIENVATSRRRLPDWWGDCSARQFPISDIARETAPVADDRRQVEGDVEALQETMSLIGDGRPRRRCVRMPQRSPRRLLCGDVIVDARPTGVHQPRFLTQVWGFAMFFVELEILYFSPRKASLSDI